MILIFIIDPRVALHMRDDSVDVEMRAFHNTVIFKELHIGLFLEDKRMR